MILIKNLKFISLFIVESFKENYYLVEDIPSVSKHQDICKFLSGFLEFPNLFLRKFLPEQDKIPTPSKSMRKTSSTSDSFQGARKESFRKDSEALIDPNFNYSDENILAICKSINLSLRIIAKMAKNSIGQNVLLYTDYLRIIPIKPSPLVNLGEVLFSTMKILNQENIEFNFINKIHYQVYKILENMLFALINLTINPNPSNPAMLSFYNSEKRKNALKSFVLEKNKNLENHQSLIKSMNGILQNYNMKNATNASLLDYFTVLNSLIEKKFNNFTEVLSRNLYKKDENNFIFCKKIVNKLHVASLELNILMTFLNNNEFKKDLDKNIELPNPRDLMTKFEDLNKFMLEKKHLKTSKNSLVQIETSGVVNYTDKIIKTIQKKIEKSIYELIYEEKREFWKESRLNILNIMNISLNLPNMSSFSCPFSNEMNLKYLNLDNITAKNILHEKKEENYLSPFISIKYNSKSHFIQSFLKMFYSTKSEIFTIVIPYLRTIPGEYITYIQKPLDITFSLKTSKI